MTSRAKNQEVVRARISSESQVIDWLAGEEDLLVLPVHYANSTGNRSPITATNSRYIAPAGVSPSPAENRSSSMRSKPTLAQNADFASRQSPKACSLSSRERRKVVERKSRI